jgi:lipopolysaccharide transport system permease protein
MPDQTQTSEVISPSTSSPPQIGLSHRKPSVYVDAKTHQLWPNWREMWEFRFVLINLVARDYKVRFKQTVLGVAWSIIQPVTTMIVFTVFFNGVAGITTPNNIPYPLFTFAALVPWTFFANGLSLASESLVGQGHLVRKVYLPRIMIPISRVLGGAIDYGISVVVLLVLMVIYGQSVPPQAWLLVPILSLWAMLLTTAIGLWTSAMMVYFRDVRYLIPYVLQIMMFVSPIAYSSERLAAEYQLLYALNPMASIIEGMRYALLGLSSLPPGAYVVSVAVTAIFLISGVAFFRRAEGRFADMI